MTKHKMEQARKLQATLDGCNPKLRPPTDLLTGVKYRATSVAKNEAVIEKCPEVVCLKIGVQNCFARTCSYDLIIRSTQQLVIVLCLQTIGIFTLSNQIVF